MELINSFRNLFKNNADTAITQKLSASLDINRYHRIYLFVSSTFNDMHAERDYLVKYVFPELRDWCFSVGLELIDIDLRWGITDDEAKNNQVVDSCLNIIRLNEPMFLINLTGDRIGWIPQRNQVSDSFIEDYPEIKSYLGKKSITELEVLFYDLVSAVDGALYLVRNPLGQVNWDNDHRKVYTNYGQNNARYFDRKSKALKKSILKKYNSYCYECYWNSALLSPELNEIGNTSAFANSISQGRFSNFTCNDMHMKDFIVDFLKKLISTRINVELADQVYSGNSEKNIQQRFLLQKGVSYLECSDMFRKLESIIENDDPNLFWFLTGEAGVGKSSYLARFILTHRDKYDIRYRFLGISKDSMSEADILKSLADELLVIINEAKRKAKTSISSFFDTPNSILNIRESDFEEKANVCENFPLLINAIEYYMDSPVVIILDGIDQLDIASFKAHWINPVLYFGTKHNIHFILSCKSGTPHEKCIKEHIVDFQSAQLEWNLLRDNTGQKKLIRYITSQHLKKLDADQEKRILNSPHSNNPLFLKCLVEELCIRGSHSELGNYMDSLISGDSNAMFNRILECAENEIQYCAIAPDKAIPAIIGLLAYSRYGLTFNCLKKAMRAFLSRVSDQDGVGKTDDDALLESIHYYTYRFQHFLVFSYGRVDMLYDSFRAVCRIRYSADKQAYHTALAEAFRTEADPQKLSEGSCAEAFMEYPYHLLNAGDYKTLQELMNDLAWQCYKAILGQTYQIPELYRSFSTNSHELAIADWIGRNSKRLSENPSTAASLLVNTFPAKKWNTSNMRVCWLKYKDPLGVSEIDYSNTFVSHCFPERIMFQNIYMKNRMIYLLHSGIRRGISVFDSDDFHLLLSVSSGLQLNNILSSLRLCLADNTIIMRKSCRAEIYKLICNGKKVVRYTINNIPKNVANIDLWYESGKLYALSSVDNADIRLSCTDIDLLVKGSTDFDALPWEELFYRRFCKKFSKVNRSAYNGTGVISLSDAETGSTILYCYPEFKILCELPFAADDWAFCGDDLIVLRLLHKSKYTVVTDRSGKTIMTINDYIVFSEPQPDGSFYFRSNINSSFDDYPKELPALLSEEDKKPSGTLKMIVNISNNSYEYLISPDIIYSIKIGNNIPLPVPIATAFQPVFQIEVHRNCIIAETVAKLMVIPLNKEKKPYTINIPQRFMGTGLRDTPCNTQKPFLIENDTLYYIDSIDKTSSSSLQIALHAKKWEMLSECSKAEVLPDAVRKYNGYGWSCVLSNDNKLSFEYNGICKQQVQLKMSMPKARIFDGGVLCLWQDNQLAVIDTSDNAKKPITVYSFPHKITEVTASGKKVWATAELPKSGKNAKVTVYLCEKQQQIRFSAVLPYSDFQISVKCIQCISHGDTYVAVINVNEEFPLIRQEISTAAKFSLDDKTKIEETIYFMISDGKSLSVVRTKYATPVKVQFLPRGTVAVYNIVNDNLLLDEYDVSISAANYKQSIEIKEAKYFDKILGTYKDYLILCSFGLKTGCIYDYIQGKQLFSFPLSDDIKFSAVHKNLVYFGNESGDKIISAEIIEPK